MALLVCAPLLVSRGYALTRDMVFVPHQPFKASWLGFDGSVPRAVPSDAFVSLLSAVVPGDILQKIVLVAILLLAGGGAAATVPDASLMAKVAATTLYVWNAFVFERLAMGHWALLLGYAVLPWVLVSARRIREERPYGWPALCAALAGAAFSSPTGGALAGVVAGCLLVGRDLSRSGRAIALVVAVNLPWIVPSLLYEGGIPSDSAGVSAFAAHSDSPFGVVGSLLTLGGIWNADVVPPGRDSIVLGGLMLVVCIAAIAGLVAARAVADLPRSRIALFAVAGFVLASLPALRGGTSAMQWVDVHLPGAGLLRDSQKWIGLLALAEAVGAAAVVTMLQRRWRRYGAQAEWWLAGVFVALPIAVMPALAWGLDNRLEPVDYPRDWAAVSARINAQSAHSHGDVAVLPWSIYRQYAWNAERPVLDPAPRYFDAKVVIADTLVVGDRSIAGEDARAAEIGRLLRNRVNVTAGLRSLGIGLVVVERHTPGLGAGVALDGRLLYTGKWLELWDLGRPAPVHAGPSELSQATMLAGDAVAGATVVGCALLVPWRRWRR